MSHIVTVRTELRDPTAIAAACRRLGLTEPVQGTAKLFSDETAGLVVKLPEWLYPIVCDTATGQIHFDNYNGAWGQQEQLDRFLQAYAVEKARIEARKQGHSAFEQLLPDGSIRLVIQLGGAA